MLDQSEQKEHSCHHVTFRPVTLKQLVHALNVGIRKTLTQSLNRLFPYNLLGIQLNYEYCLETGISAVLLVTFKSRNQEDINAIIELFVSV